MTALADTSRAAHGRAVSSTSPPTQREGRVLRIAGGIYHVDLGPEILECALRGRLKLGNERVTTGDRVLVERLPDGGCRIAKLLPRTRVLSRRAAAGPREQVIVANVDRLAAVFAIARPAPDLRLLDRFLALAELNDLPAFLIVNKMDLAEGPASASPQSSSLDVYRDAGYPVVWTSAHRQEGIDELREKLTGRATVLAGPSGAGKTSLLNLLLPDEELRVREVSRRLGRGKHTTVSSTFYRLPGGGYVADTPGLQYLALWKVSPDELAGAFPEFRPALGGCRFNDCRHLEEPECAVRNLVRSGEASEGRYLSYVALLEEAREAQW